MTVSAPAGTQPETHPIQRTPNESGRCVRIIRDVAEIEGIRSAWEQWQKHPNCDIDFYKTILRERAEILGPQIFVAYRDGRPVAMLVGRLESKRLAFKLGYLTVFRPHLKIFTFPLGGLLGDSSPEISKLLVEAVIGSLRNREAHLAFFEPMDVASAFYQSVLHLPGPLCKDYLHPVQVHRSMELFETADAFLQSLSPKVRKNLKWQAKKLAADFAEDVRIVQFRGTHEVDELIATVESIARHTYQRALGVGFSNNAEMRARLHLEAGKGWLRGYVLQLGGKPAAFWLGSLYDCVFHSNFMGYDPAFGKYSPGMYLVTTVIAELCQAAGQERPSRIDFGLGDAQYKQVLGTTAWDESGLTLFAPTMKGVMLNAVRTFVGLSDRLARKALGNWQLLGRVRTRWRQLARKGLENSGNAESHAPKA